MHIGGGADHEFEAGRKAQAQMLINVMPLYCPLKTQPHRRTSAILSFDLAFTRGRYYHALRASLLRIHNAKIVMSRHSSILGTGKFVIIQEREVILQDADQLQ